MAIHRLAPAGIGGLDLSLTATGIATAQGVQTLRTKAAPDTQVIDRLMSIADTIMRITLEQNIGLWVIEDMINSTRGHGVQTGKLHGVVHSLLHRNGIRTIHIPPATLKKFATGKGNAGKVAVIKAAWERLGYDGEDDNEADAAWLRELGLHLHKCGSVQLPQAHTAALNKITNQQQKEAIQ